MIEENKTYKFQSLSQYEESGQQKLVLLSTLFMILCNCSEPSKMRSIWEVGSEQLCYYEERNDIGENYIIIIGKDNDNE